MSVNDIFKQAISDIIDNIGPATTDDEQIIYNGGVVSGVFLKVPILINTGSGEIETTGPAVRVKSEDFPNVAHNDQITIGTTTYRVTGIKEDTLWSKVLDLVKT